MVQKKPCYLVQNHMPFVWASPLTDDANSRPSRSNSTGERGKNEVFHQQRRHAVLAGSARWSARFCLTQRSNRQQAQAFWNLFFLKPATSQRGIFSAELFNPYRECARDVMLGTCKRPDSCCSPNSCNTQQCDGRSLLHEEKSGVKNRENHCNRRARGRVPLARKCHLEHLCIAAPLHNRHCGLKQAH